MKTLLILRHAKAASDLPVADHDRPLTARGERQAKEVGRWIKEQQIVPQLIVASTAARALATAELTAAACGNSSSIKQDGAIYMAEVDALLEAVRRLPSRESLVMIVGHNPGLEGLLARLTNCDDRLSPASLARIETPAKTWDEITAIGHARLHTLRHTLE